MNKTLNSKNCSKFFIRLKKLVSLLFFFSRSFISADKAVGQQGFKAIWTEVAMESDCSGQFLCVTNKYCITEGLRCNGINNCGPDDSSDEENCKF